MRTNTKKNYETIGIVLLSVVLILGIIGGITLFGEEKTAKKLNLSWSVGGLNGEGKYLKTKETIYTKDIFACKGLSVTLDFESQVQYKIFYYNADGTFAGATSEWLTSNYVIPETDSYTHARIVVKPLNDDEVAFYEVYKYAMGITVEIVKNQSTITPGEDSPGDDPIVEDVQVWSQRFSKDELGDYAAIQIPSALYEKLILSSDLFQVEFYLANITKAKLASCFSSPLYLTFLKIDSYYYLLYDISECTEFVYVYHSSIAKDVENIQVLDGTDLYNQAHVMGSPINVAGYDYLSLQIPQTLFNSISRSPGSLLILFYDNTGSNYITHDFYDSSYEVYFEEHENYVVLKYDVRSFASVALVYINALRDQISSIVVSPEYEDNLEEPDVNVYFDSEDFDGFNIQIPVELYEILKVNRDYLMISTFTSSSSNVVDTHFSIIDTSFVNVIEGDVVYILLNVDNFAKFALSFDATIAEYIDEVIVTGIYETTGGGDDNTEPDEEVNTDNLYSYFGGGYLSSAGELTTNKADGYSSYYYWSNVIDVTDFDSVTIVIPEEAWNAVSSPNEILRLVYWSGDSVNSNESYIEPVVYWDCDLFVTSVSGDGVNMWLVFNVSSCEHFVIAFEGDLVNYADQIKISGATE